MDWCWRERGNTGQTVTQYSNKFRWLQVFFTFCRQTLPTDAMSLLSHLSRYNITLQQLSGAWIELADPYMGAGNKWPQMSKWQVCHLSCRTISSHDASNICRNVDGLVTHVFVLRKTKMSYICFVYTCVWHMFWLVNSILTDHMFSINCEFWVNNVLWGWHLTGRFMRIVCGTVYVLGQCLTFQLSPSLFFQGSVFHKSVPCVAFWPAAVLLTHDAAAEPRFEESCQEKDFLGELSHFFGKHFLWEHLGKN